MEQPVGLQDDNKSSGAEIEEKETMALEFDIRDPKNQKTIAMVLVPVVILYAFFHFMIKPNIDTLKEKKVEVVKIKKRVDDIKKTLRNPEELTAEKALLDEQFKEIEILLPSEENVAVLLDQFSTVENDTKVYIVGFEAIESVEDEGKPYRANKYRLTVESGYHQYARFMSSVMSLPRIMSFTELVITLNTGQEQNADILEGLEDQPRTLKIECTLTTYVFKGFGNEGS